MGYFKSKETEDRYKAAKKQGGLTQHSNYKNKYYEKPKKCKFCLKVLDYTKRTNKFCDQSCAASFNNQGVVRHGVAVKDRKKLKCICCGKLVGRNSTKFCSLKCQQDYDYLIYINKWKLGLESGSYNSGNISNYIRRYLKCKYPVCAECCIDFWNNKKLVLEVHHIDGDYTNNTEINLTKLCPNCHTQTPTHRYLNKGKGRKSRRLIATVTQFGRVPAL